jgi:hypothetical protein
MIGSSAHGLVSVPRAPRHLRRALRLSTGVLLLGTLLYWSAFQRASLAVRPEFFAAVVGALLAVAAANVLFVFADLRARHIGHVRAAAAIAFLAGALLAGGGGLLAWLSRVEGFLVLHEREAAQLASTSGVAEFEAGPLAPRHELDATVQLERLELRSSGTDGVRSLSRLRIVDAHGKPAEVEVGDGAPIRFGGLVLRQGAFGLAPRIAVTRRDEPVFDDFVPFTARRDGGGEVTFSGAKTVHLQELLVTGSVTIDPREGAGPNARLRIRLADASDLIGEATLGEGSFADLGNGYRVRFSGLRHWSEIGVSRRERQEPLLAGALLALVGAALWPIAAWRKW